jgi:hypothetical protein
MFAFGLIRVDTTMEMDRRIDWEYFLGWSTQEIDMFFLMER